MSGAIAAVLVLYDGECRVCSLAARGLLAIDFRGRVRLRPLQESAGLPISLPFGELRRALHVMTPEGRVEAGGDALLTLLAALLGGRPAESLGWASPALRSLSGHLYGLLANLRGHLTCRIVPAVSEPAFR